MLLDVVRKSAAVSRRSGWPRAVARPRLPQSLTCAH